MRQRYRSHQLVPNRGAVLDRHGMPLAVTVYGHGVYAVPAAVTDPKASAERLAELLGRPVDELVELLTRDSGSVWLTDRLEPAGVYFGTNSGALYASADEGDNWRCIAQHLPMITSVETLVVDA